MGSSLWPGRRPSPPPPQSPEMAPHLTAGKLPHRAPLKLPFWRGDSLPAASWEFTRVVKPLFKKLLLLEPDLVLVPASLEEEEPTPDSQAPFFLPACPLSPFNLPLIYQRAAGSPLPSPFPDRRAPGARLGAVLGFVPVWLFHSRHWAFPESPSGEGRRP